MSDSKPPPAIILFQHVDFGGAARRFESSVKDLKGFSKTISSVIVCDRDSKWVLWSGAGYTGNSWSVSLEQSPLDDGLYRSYSDWGGENDKISSLQLLD